MTKINATIIAMLAMSAMAFTACGDDDEASDPVELQSISLDRTSLDNVAVDSVDQLVVTFNPSNAFNKEVTWATSDSAVVVASQEGVITATGEGSATITVTSKVNANINATCDVAVVAKQEPEAE